MDQSAVDRFWAKVERRGPDDCWNWTARGVHGYGIMRVDGKNQRSNRLSWLINRGPIPDEMVVMHSCDNRACVNPAHLSIGTQAQNLADMRAKGRHSHGEAHRGAKIDCETAAKIKALLLQGVPQRVIAKAFGRCRYVVQAIREGRTWRGIMPYMG